MDKLLNSNMVTALRKVPHRGSLSLWLQSLYTTDLHFLIFIASWWLPDSIHLLGSLQEHLPFMLWHPLIGGPCFQLQPVDDLTLGHPDRLVVALPISPVQKSGQTIHDTVRRRDHTERANGSLNRLNATGIHDLLTEPKWPRWKFKQPWG